MSNLYVTVDISREAAAAASSAPRSRWSLRPTDRGSLLTPQNLSVCCRLLSAVALIKQIFSDRGDTPVSSAPHVPLLAAAHHETLRSHSFSLHLLVPWAPAVQLCLSFCLSHVCAVCPSFSEKRQIGNAATRLFDFYKCWRLNLSATAPKSPLDVAY